VQPTVPIRINSAGLDGSVENHPTTAVIFVVVKDVALLVGPDLDAFAPRPKLGAECLIIPPRENAFDCIQKAHRLLLDAVDRSFARNGGKGPVRYALGANAVSSISILYLGSIKAAEIIVAAGGLSSNAAAKTGQQGSKSAGFGRI
jgi:hypothetical protein